MSKKGQVKDLHASSENPRKITDKELQMLGASMEEFGDLSGIVFNVTTDRLVGGHQRVKELDASWKVVKKTHIDDKGTVAVGHIETPHGRFNYREVEWDEKKETLANISANQQGGEFVKKALEEALIEMDDGSVDIELSGFDAGDIQKMLADHYEEEKTEVEFSEELLLEHNYIVMYFDNPLDWEVAKEKFKLKKVKDLIERKGQPVGTGRVIRGADWLEKINGS